MQTHLTVLSLKGTVPRDEYFSWRTKHFNQYFLCMRLWFSRSFTLQFLTFYSYWNPPPQIPFSVICRCSSADLSLAAEKMRKNYNLSYAASGMILQNHWWLPVCIFSVMAGSWSSKRVTGRFFKISNFKGASKNFQFIFLSTKKQKL